MKSKTRGRNRDRGRAGDRAAAAEVYVAAPDAAAGGLAEGAGLAAQNRVRHPVVPRAGRLPTSQAISTPPAIPAPEDSSCPYPPLPSPIATLSPSARGPGVGRSVHRLAVTPAAVAIHVQRPGRRNARRRFCDARPRFRPGRRGEAETGCLKEDAIVEARCPLLRGETTAVASGRGGGGGRRRLRGDRCPRRRGAPSHAHGQSPP